MTATDITKEFEEEFAEWIGTEFALAYCNGTESLRAAMWGCGVGAGDEIICPGMTFWASYTKAILVVHYAGYPCEMDEILDIARKHKIKVIEDVSHAHGTLYKGRKCGTFGDIAGMSIMTGKSLAAGEGGIMVTNDRTLYERCVAYGHYERTGGPSNYAAPDQQVTDPELSKYSGIPLGGFKHRMHQLTSAVARVQLKHYDKRVAEIQKSMYRFWDLLEGTPGIRAHCPPKDSGSTMGGWYTARGLYRSEELGELPCEKYCDAVRAEGVEMCTPGANFALHIHPVFHDADVLHTGKPAMVSFTERDVRQGPGTLPVAEKINEIAFGVPWFKHNRPEIIKDYAAAYRKVAEHAGELKGTA